MEITENRVVTINYTLKDTAGKVLEETGDSGFAYLHGARNIIPGLENALTNHKQGDTLSVTVPPEQAYGMRNEEMKQVVPMEMFGDEQQVEKGMQFHAQSPDGQMLVVTVADVEGDQVTVDGNHPFAGMTLDFDVEVVEVRDATSEELDHGHVHGPEGHDH